MILSKRFYKNMPSEIYLTNLNSMIEQDLVILWYVVGEAISTERHIYELENHFMIVAFVLFITII
jgi:hypothetical protein